MTTRRELANAVRALAMDAVEAANSGHPGMPMGMADIAEVLWNDFLKFNPANPKWPNRDRFVLSNGHGSMLQYALLHLTGFDCRWRRSSVSASCIQDRRATRKPAETPGVETTTGPLGQGLANAVGFALAEKVLAAQFNRPGHTIVDHHTYVFLRRRLPDGRHLARGLPRSPVPGSWASWLRSTTTTASPSTAKWKAGSPTTRQALRGVWLERDPRRRWP